MSVTKIAVILLGLAMLYCLYGLILPSDDLGVFKYFTRQYRAERQNVLDLQADARSLDGCRVVVQDIKNEQEVSATITDAERGELHRAMLSLKPAPPRGSRGMLGPPELRINIHLANGRVVVLNSPGYWRDPQGRLAVFATRVLQKYPTRPYELSESEKHNKQVRLQRGQAIKEQGERATNGTP